MKIKKLALFPIFILISINIYAQVPGIQWKKCLGGTGDDRANYIKQTSDGGFIIAGQTNSNNGDVSGNHGGYDSWIVKLSNSGDIEWKKCLGGNGTDVSTSIQQTNDGGFIVAGYTSSNDSNVSGNHGGYDYWIVKLSNSGDIEWQKCLGGENDDRANSIQQTNDGGYIVAGRSASIYGDVSGNHCGYDYWIVKLNSLGDIQWQKCLGGNGTDESTSIQQTNDGGYIVAGYTFSNNSDVSGNHGGDDYWIVKLNNSGDIEWRKCYGGTHDDYAKCIQQTNDGGFIVAGYTLSNDGDVSGNHDNNGTYYEGWIVKLDNLGDIEWQKCLGGTNNDYATCIQQTNDGGFIVGGYTCSNNGDVSGNHGTNDSWIIKLAPMLIVDAGPDRIICNGDSIAIGGSPTASECIPPYTYLWNNSGSLNDSTIANPIAFPNITTTYTLTVTDSIGNINTDSVTITVNNVYFFTETDTVCGGKLWHGNYYNLSGIYYDSLITINNCDSVYKLNLFVYPLPYINLGNDTTINISDTININAGSGFNSYLWNNGSTDSLITVYGSIGQGIYTYYVNVTDTNGCSNSDTIIITITTEDGYIELNNTIKVNIYPNPVQDKLNIEINGLIDNDLSIEFFDINGEKLLNKNFNNNSDVIYETIDLSNYANGVYFIIIKSNNLIKTEKIIKV
ncbi:MAG: T9SS type A sorting domain-containing protein [Bacteroidales bacterium]|nr:T9SS type A sorting domain-containing protein [Bacteroidales bacterium]